MILDDLLPEYNFTEIHHNKVKASTEAVYRAAVEITPVEINFIMRLLFFLSDLPERAVGRKASMTDKRRPLLQEMLQSGFTLLAEQEPHEIVFGLVVPGNIGRFWQKSSAQNIVPADAGEFLAFNNPDYLLVVGNILVGDMDESGMVDISTESRTRALSRRSYKKFIPYWRIIRPFSGLIRRLWLRGIKRRAELRGYTPAGTNRTLSSGFKPGIRS